MIYTASAVFNQEDNMSDLSRACIIHAMNLLAQDIMINSTYEIQIYAEISELVTSTKGERVYTVGIRILGER